MKKFAVWEPSNETAAKATEIEADTHGQAAFLCASKRKIGYQDATYIAFDGTEAQTVRIEAQVWYAVVDVSEPLQAVRAVNNSPVSPNAS